MAVRAVRAISLAATLAFAQSQEASPAALAADDACLANGGEDCSLELRQLRGERVAEFAVEEIEAAASQIGDASAEDIIAAQMTANLQHETDAEDESGMTCHIPKPWGGLQITCGAGTKCCTSKPSYIAGQAKSTQTHMNLYSICCSVNEHCKFDTIFVSCAAGHPSKDDYSGVIAGLEEEAEVRDAEEEEDAEVNVEQEDAETAEEAEEEDTEEETSGFSCKGVSKNAHTWNSGGHKKFDGQLNKCGRGCAAGHPCTQSCMAKHGYTSKCANCMATLVECSRDHCLNQCITNDKSPACTGCVKKQCRPGMKRCSGWNVGGH